MKDWDKEMAKVDALMSKEAKAPPPARTAASSPAPPAAASPPTVSRKAGLYTWLRLSLALILGVGMTQWPYLHGCGVPLFAYLGGVATVLVASCWSLISSWRSRSSVAHFLSVGLLFWGSALGARELLPRIGYARQSATWMCAQPGQVISNPVSQPQPQPPPVTPSP